MQLTFGRAGQRVGSASFRLEIDGVLLRQALRTMPTRGFSVIELCLAFLILGLSFLPVIGLFSSSGRQSRQTADYGLAVTLEEKVAEDIRLANWENTHLPEQLLSDPSFTATLPIVDGQSPFFASIEDARPPFGQIQSGVDPGIEGSFRSLFHEVSTFRLGLSQKSESLATGSVTDLTLNMDWVDYRRQTQSLPLLVRLARYGSWIASPEQVHDREQANESVRQLLYPTRAGQTLAAVAASTGADLGVVQTLGDTAVLAKAVSDSKSRFAAATATLRSAVFASVLPEDSVRKQLTLAREYERQCSTCLVIVTYLASPIKTLARSFDPAKLGTPRPAKSTYASVLQNLDDVLGLFHSTLSEALRWYVRAYNASFVKGMAPRPRIRAFMKILELTKLRTLATNAQDTAYLQKILTDFERHQDGRNSNFASFARHELSVGRDVATLRQNYPLTRLQAINDFQDNIVSAVNKVLSAP